MKSREKKREDLNALTEKFKNSKSAIVLSFSKLTVDKDQQFRNELRETGATYKVVKNTLARLAVKGTSFEEAAEYFNGVTSVAWTDGEPVDLSKIVSKYVKENKDIFEFKTGIVEGKVVDINEVTAIASLPSKEGLIAKLLFVLNAPAQGVATVLNAVPRDLAIVTQQISERAEAQAEQKAEEAPAAKKAEEKPSEEAVEEKKENITEAEVSDEKSEGGSDDSKEK